MVKRRVEPLLWLLFSSGGLATALLLPVLLLPFGLVFPPGWGVGAPDQAHLLAVARNPLTRIVLLGLCVLALFHWAHMFRPLHALLRTPAAHLSFSAAMAARWWARSRRATSC